MFLTVLKKDTDKAVFINPLCLELPQLKLPTFSRLPRYFAKNNIQAEDTRMRTLVSLLSEGMIEDTSCKESCSSGVLLAIQTGEKLAALNTSSSVRSIPAVCVCVLRLSTSCIRHFKELLKYEMQLAALAMQTNTQKLGLMTVAGQMHLQWHGSP